MLALVLYSRSIMSDSVTPWTVAHHAPLSIEILQARILEWVAMPSSKGPSQPRDGTHVFYVSHIRQVLTTSATCKAPTGQHSAQGLKALLWQSPEFSFSQ